MTASDHVRVVIISDGKRGHENQSRVLARMLGDTEPLLMYLRDRIVEWPLRLKFATLGTGWLERSQAELLTAKMLRPEYIEDLREFARDVGKDEREFKVLVVSTGTPPATLNLVVSRLFGVRNVVNMTPSMLPRSLFDLNVIPAHDLKGNVGENVVVSTLALGYHDTAAAQLLAAELKTDYSLTDDKYWGVAIGGSSKSCPWSGDRILDELAKLHGLARGMGAKLLVTTSRRTPEYCMTWLKKHYIESDVVSYFLDAAVDTLNPLPAFYEIAERMFVTMDSYSMLCEAIQAGHTPVGLKVRDGIPEGKLGRSLGSLAKSGLVLIDEGGLSLEDRLPTDVPRRSEVNGQYETLRSAVREKLNLKG